MTSNPYLLLCITMGGTGYSTNNAERTAQGFTFSHFLWSSPLEVVISALLAYLEIGWPALVGLLLLVLQMPIQAGINEGLLLLSLPRSLLYGE